MSLPLSDPLDPKTVEAIRARADAVDRGEAVNMFSVDTVRTLLRQLAEIEKARLFAVDVLAERADEVIGLHAELSRLRAQQAELVKHATAMCKVWDDDNDRVGDDVFFEIVESLRAALPPATTGEKRA